MSSIFIDEKGKKTVTHPGTKSHPEGNAPRDKDGIRLDRPAPEKQAADQLPAASTGGKTK